MQNDARRADILTQLSKSQKPVSATALAEKYHLSRQSIVGDIALLRAAGNDLPRLSARNAAESTLP